MRRMPAIGPSESPTIALCDEHLKLFPESPHAEEARRERAEQAPGAGDPGHDRISSAPQFFSPSIFKGAHLHRAPLELAGCEPA